MDKYLDNLLLLDDLANKLSLALYKNISHGNVVEILFMLWGDKLKLRDAGEIAMQEIEFNNTYEELKAFDFTSYETFICSDYELIEDVLLYEKKQQIKVDGVIWRIHQNDADPWPSQPHAHQVEENIKLDLNNGNCYRNRQLIKILNKKHLKIIQQQVLSKFKGDLSKITF